MIKQIRHRSSAEQGFTIVELMIATTVLSTLLVVVAIVMISIGKLYYKGLNQARLQDNTRNAVTAIAKQLQLNTGDPATRSPAYDATGLAAGAPRDLHFEEGTNPADGQPNKYDISAYCIGTVRYSFIKNRQIGPGVHQIPHVLWRDKASGGPCGPVDLRTVDKTTDPGGVELIGPNSALTEFKITNPQDKNAYLIEVGEAYGDIYAPDALFSGKDMDTTCITGSGDQFCATANLTTTVVKRLGVN
jgi:prepilin-type N-terminal cleavage/methylation domain-containing protein